MKKRRGSNTQQLPIFSTDPLVLHGDVLKVEPAGLFHGVLCDPPYELGFMGKGWDKSGIAFNPATWARIASWCLPGAHLLAFGGTRTFHRLACAIEDAGWEIRDTLLWVYGSGFPKSLDVSKAIDFDACRGDLTARLGRKPSKAELKAAWRAWREAVGKNPNTRKCHSEQNTWRTAEGRVPSPMSSPVITAPATDAAKQWAGYGTALKPAFELVILARKPLDGTVAANCLTHGCGAINVDGCRIAPASADDINQQRRIVGFNKNYSHGEPSRSLRGGADGSLHKRDRSEHDPTSGRWPANLILSCPEDEYELRDDVTPEQLRQLAGWLDAH